jgi:hypothetical protein
MRGQFLFTLASFVKKMPFLLSFTSYSWGEPTDMRLVGKRK